ncbi:Transposase_28 domain-containing protein [Cephalotus follicularis]|uniref:Transposase_28 domain-containing protein n=1 Tax=Cephalotus follicularis TaxID=3775 RepID=A0A1Q3C1C6_CEPFO|nr:Transposase_28 domain-containing protein [Cephalotus follicularis]
MEATAASAPDVASTEAGVQVFRAPFEPSNLRPRKVGEPVKEYSLPRNLDYEILKDPQMAMENKPGYFVVFQDALEHGLRLPLPPFAVTVLRYYQIHPSILQAQSWRFIISFLVRCLKSGVTVTMGLFKEFHTLSSSPSKRGFYFKSRAGQKKLLAENTKTVKSWGGKYFMVKNLIGFTPCSWCDTLDTVRLNQRMVLTGDEKADLGRLSTLAPEEVGYVVFEDCLRRVGLSMSQGRRVRLELEEEIPMGVRRERGLDAWDEPASSTTIQ